MIVNNIFSVNEASFNHVALQVFAYQYQQNQVYRKWVNALGINVNSIISIADIPFLPISFFKTHQVTAGTFSPDIVFTSSGTTGAINSQHFIKHLQVYEESFNRGFNFFYGDVSDWCIIGLLPSYLERSGSSLVYMVDALIKSSGHPFSNFYLYEINKLGNVLRQLETEHQKTLLVGVTFALLDFAEQYNIPLHQTTIMETGGMKGRRREMVRTEVHQQLTNAFGVQHIHSEYGMTELLSQAYSAGNGLFTTVPWMKVLLREEDDPLLIKQTGRGLINVIDLANVHSCSFIATDDVGQLYANGSFEVLGRADASDIRGCSLLAV